MPPAIDGQQAMRQFVKCCVSSPPHQFDLASVGERVSGALERDDLAAGMGLRQEVREIERRYPFERCQDRAFPFSHGSPRAAYSLPLGSSGDLPLRSESNGLKKILPRRSQINEGFLLFVPILPSRAS